MSVIDGVSGVEDEVQIPAKSFRMITDIVFDFEGNSEAFDRSISFRAVRDAKDVNHSEVVVNTVSVEGCQVDAEVRIIYRGGTFRKGLAQVGESEFTFIRLTDVLHFIENPGQI